MTSAFVPKHKKVRVEFLGGTQFLRIWTHLFLIAVRG